MAPLPPESTARFYLDYFDGTNEHTMIARLGEGADVSTAQFHFDAFLEAIQGACSELTIVGARVSSDNSNVTNPVDWLYASTYGTGVMTAGNEPRELRFIGRSPDGRRVSLSLYGWDQGTPATYRVPASSSVPVANAIAALTAAGAASVFLTISTGVPVWKPYASFNFNSYWEREQRG